MELVEALCFPKSLNLVRLPKLPVLPKIAEIVLFTSFRLALRFRQRAPLSLTPAPASIWILWQLPILAIVSIVKSLPSIVRKRLVGFRHAVHVFLLLDGRAAIIGRVQQFIGKLVHHAFFAAFTRIAHNPADG